eukprot:Trichotokara_eunicae@DN6310_c1_g1_i3.p1
MVGEDGQGTCRVRLVQLVAGASKRFGQLPTPEEMGKQLLARHKFLPMIALTEFRPSNEQQFEDWVDRSARSIKKHRLCLQLFTEAWEAQATESDCRDIAAASG